MADAAINSSDNSTSSITDPSLFAMQALLAQAQTELNLQQGEFAMLISDMPAAPPQTPAIVMVAQTNQAARANAKRVMGVCYVVANIPGALEKYDAGIFPSQEIVDPWGHVSAYFREFEHRDINIYAGNAGPLDTSSSVIVQPPKHGTLVDAGVGKYQAYFYKPDAGYFGNDSAVIEAEVNGLKVKINYYFHSLDTKAYTESAVCGEKGYIWKISQTLDGNGNNILTSVNYPSPFTSNTGSSTTDTAALASTLKSSILKTLSVDPSSVTFNLATLPGGAVGQDMGNAITLDTNAAGNGWFIDATPADNSEFLATSNPNEWVAKAGSAAAGKMDMLSVLLHEYGHALGIEHSANSHDFMGTTLTVGVRRLPSPAELALMQQLIAEAKNALSPTPLPQAGEGQNGPDNTPFPGLPISLGGLAFAGLLRTSRYGSSSIDVLTTPKYDVAANAAFTSLNTATGWNTQGSVDVVNATATLNEVSTSQTRLSQVFMVGAQDRYLSFTLAGSALDNPTGAPQDAFEVALLDANTGASVLGTDGMTRSDAFLNLQADGGQHAASCVTCIHNSDGSRTYRVDLTNVAKNTAVNLSFDLLGFGAANSHVTLRDVRVSGLPQLHDDVATLLEDGTLAFDPFAQADAALRPMLASSVVNAPTHGAITVNADGTFSYKPDANYNGTDSFSYRLSDGPLDSNLATVSLTVTSVNDAPTGTNATVTTLENAPYVRFSHPPSVVVCRKQKFTFRNCCR